MKKVRTIFYTLGKSSLKLFRKIGIPKAKWKFKNVTHNGVGFYKSMKIRKSKICYTAKAMFIFINKLSFHTGNIVKLQ